MTREDRRAYGTAWLDYLRDSLRKRPRDGAEARARQSLRECSDEIAKLPPEVRDRFANVVLVELSRLARTLRIWANWTLIDGVDSKGAYWFEYDRERHSG